MIFFDEQISIINNTNQWLRVTGFEYPIFPFEALYNKKKNYFNLSNNPNAEFL